MKSFPPFTRRIASAAAGITDAQLQNWRTAAARFQPPLREIGAPLPGRRQRRYAALDVFRLGLIGVLLENGRTLAEAFDLLDQHVEPILRTLPGTLPPPLTEADWLVAALAGMTLWVPSDLEQGAAHVSMSPQAPDDWKVFCAVRLGRLALHSRARLREMQAATPETTAGD